MKKENLFLSSIDENAVSVANKYSIGVEVAEYCTAFNMDLYFEKTDKIVRSYIDNTNSKRFTFHGPFNELSPASIDPKVLEVTKERYVQAIKLAESYGINRLIIHSGFTPDMYFPIWFHERSVEFWKQFLKDVPGNYEILYENVFERNPEQLAKIVEEVSSERFKLCFDLGHANVITEEKDMLGWLDVYAPYISHFHIHNNHGNHDEHGDLFSGSIDMKAFLEKAYELCPNATYTVEIVNAEPSIKWLFDNGFVK